MSWPIWGCRSFMSKFLVEGRDAGRLLNRLSTADVDGAADEITYVNHKT